MRRAFQHCSLAGCLAWLALLSLSVTMWLAVGVADAAGPTNHSPPAISGTPRVGSELTEKHGRWTPKPSSYAYQWEDCTGSRCVPIPGATEQTYTLTDADAGHTVVVFESADGPRGTSGPVSSAPTTLVTPLPAPPPAPPPPPPRPALPANVSPPTIWGIAEVGQTLAEGHGKWTNDPISFSYQWADCTASASSCRAIPGATSQTHVIATGEVGERIVVRETAGNAGGHSKPASSAPTAVVTAVSPPGKAATATSLLASLNAAVTNQAVTLIATVTSTVSSRPPSGAMTFENGGRPIGGCANEPVTRSGQSVTVLCAASFPASTAELTAVFTPGAGSLVTGSISPTDAVAVGRDSTSTSLDASNPVNVGQSTTYTASVTPPVGRPGPVEPTGSVEFLDGGQPIGACLSQALTNGGATCTVTYKAPGGHHITARYLGDANFNGSASSTQTVNAVPVPVHVLGRITSTIAWTFYYTPSYTKVLALVLNGAPTGATVLLKCHGRGCPFAHHATLVTTHMHCSQKAKRTCSAGRRVSLTPDFEKHRLAIGAQITVMIVRTEWIGKYYAFTVRARRGPRIQVDCLAPGRTRPGGRC